VSASHAGLEHQTIHPTCRGEPSSRCVGRAGAFAPHWAEAHRFGARRSPARARHASVSLASLRPAQPLGARGVLALLLALASTESRAAEGWGAEERVGFGLAARVVQIESFGPVESGTVYEGHVEAEVSWRVAGVRLGARGGLLSMRLRPYGGDLSFVCRAALPPGKRRVQLSLVGALGLEVGPEVFGHWKTTPVAAIGAIDVGVEVPVPIFQGKFGAWVRVQLKTPSGSAVSPSVGLFFGYAVD
jgi:hypothetical protein